MDLPNKSRKLLPQPRELSRGVCSQGRSAAFYDGTRSKRTQMNARGYIVAHVHFRLGGGILDGASFSCSHVRCGR